MAWVSARFILSESWSPLIVLLDIVCGRNVAQAEKKHSGCVAIPLSASAMPIIEVDYPGSAMETLALPPNAVVTEARPCNG